MVVGAGGGVGIHMVQMARVFGAQVVAVDLGGEKLALARQLGAAHALDFGEAGPLERLKAFATRGVTVAVDLVGRRETLAFCLEALDARGRLVLLTTFPGVAVEVEPRRMVRDEISVLGSRYTSRWELLEAARLVARGAVKPVVTAVTPLERVGETHAKLRARTLLGRGAIAF
jgi:D-arabinose 1-dehydrogenase-like Zn-dependent alcohol dehydrogenase